MDNYERLQEIGKGNYIYLHLSLNQEAMGQFTKLKGNLMDRFLYGRN